MNMVPIVQLVRASDCGSECRGFESHWAPKKEVFRLPFFVLSPIDNDVVNPIQSGNDAIFSGYLSYF